MGAQFGRRVTMSSNGRTAPSAQRRDHCFASAAQPERVSRPLRALVRQAHVSAHSWLFPNVAQPSQQPPWAFTSSLSSAFTATTPE